MQVIKLENKFFSPKETLECGQVFRFKPYLKGYLVFSADKCCYIYEENGFTYIESEDAFYFENYFDVKRNYQKIYDGVRSFNNNFLNLALEQGKGIRILKQDKIETIFSFIISQNNNIVRIKSIIEKLCKSLGDKKFFMGEEYYSFPTVQKLASKDVEFYRSIGLGYRDAYIVEFAKKLAGGYDISYFDSLDTASLEKELIKIYGVGKKVADCILLFAYNRSDSFPVDTWIEKVYKENFNGKQKDRSKISKELLGTFKELSGYVQQYVFNYKRTLWQMIKIPL